MADELDRRTFLAGMATAAACACASCPLAAFGKDQRGDPAEAAGPIEVGTLDDFPRDGVYDVTAKPHGFFLIRRGGALYALSSTCTHKKALLKVKGAAIVCPKHGARFDLGGDVRKAPARRPLPRLGISLDEAGRVIVDPTRTFGKSDRDDPASFIPLG